MGMEETTNWGVVSFFIKKHCFIVKKSVYFVKNKQKVKNGTKNEIEIVSKIGF